MYEVLRPYMDIAIANIEFGMQNNGHYHINYGEPLKQTGRVKVD